jgi:opacity protein-like surface antigen
MPVFVVGALLTASPAFAQASPVFPRFDASGYVGWLAAEDDMGRARRGRGWADSLFGALGAGWYWREHLKLEVDVGAGTAATAYRLETVLIDGAQTYQASESTFSRRTLGVSQQYQYGRNAWFHPHIGAGLHVTWERRSTRYQPLVVYGGTPPGRVVREAYVDGPGTNTTLRPFVTAGFKGYVTPRVFFRSDLRLALRHGLEESLLRAGFGVDF